VNDQPRRLPWWAALLAGCGCLGIGATELRLDPDRSRVGFSIPVLWLFARTGDFEDLALAVDIDHEAQKVDIEAQIRVASARMENPADVATLKSRDYFDALNHPYIVFQALDAPLSVLSEGGELSGELSLRGVTRTVRFQLSPDACAPSAEIPFCPFEVVGHIRRHDFGMSARRGILGDEVTVSIYLVPAALPAIDRPDPPTSASMPATD